MPVSVDTQITEKRNSCVPLPSAPRDSLSLSCFDIRYQTVPPGCVVYLLLLLVPNFLIKYSVDETLHIVDLELIMLCLPHRGSAGMRSTRFTPYF